MSSVVVKKKHIAFISAPATKRVERLLKSTELRREAGETCKSCLARTSNGRMQASARFSCCHQSAGKPLRYVLGRGRPRWVPASRPPHRAPARPAGGLASSRRPGPPSKSRKPASPSATLTGRCSRTSISRTPVLYGRGIDARGSSVRDCGCYVATGLWLFVTGLFFENETKATLSVAAG